MSLTLNALKKLERRGAFNAPMPEENPSENPPPDAKVTREAPAEASLQDEHLDDATNASLNLSADPVNESQGEPQDDEALSAPTLVSPPEQNVASSENDVTSTRDQDESSPTLEDTDLTEAELDSSELPLDDTAAADEAHVPFGMADFDVWDSPAVNSIDETDVKVDADEPTAETVEPTQIEFERLEEPASESSDAEQPPGEEPTIRESMGAESTKDDNAPLSSLHAAADCIDETLADESVPDESDSADNVTEDNVTEDDSYDIASLVDFDEVKLEELPEPFAPTELPYDDSPYRPVIPTFDALADDSEDEQPIELGPSETRASLNQEAHAAPGEDSTIAPDAATDEPDALPLELEGAGIDHAHNAREESPYLRHKLTGEESPNEPQSSSTHEPPDEPAEVAPIAEIRNEEVWEAELASAQRELEELQHDELELTFAAIPLPEPPRPDTPKADVPAADAANVVNAADADNAVDADDTCDVDNASHAAHVGLELEFSALVTRSDDSKSEPPQDSLPADDVATSPGALDELTESTSEPMDDSSVAEVESGFERAMSLELKQPHVESALSDLLAKAAIQNGGELPQDLVVMSAVPTARTADLTLMLAMALSRQGKKILVVDGNLAEQTLTRRLDALGAMGFCDILARDELSENCVRATGQARVEFIPCGDDVTGLSRDPELLAIEDLSGVMRTWANCYDHVFIDAGAHFTVMAESFGQSKSPMLLVLSAPLPPDEQLEQWAHVLKDRPARVLGAVMTDCQ